MPPPRPPRHQPPAARSAAPPGLIDPVIDCIRPAIPRAAAKGVLDLLDEAHADESRTVGERNTAGLAASCIREELEKS